ncbi:MAG: hypothetical protein ACYTAF_15970, partial [Planctomycetota bacterium]
MNTAVLLFALALAAQDKPLSERFPLDGKVDLAALEGVQEKELHFLGTEAKSTTLRWAFANDDRDLYVAAEWTDDTFNNGHSFTGPTDFDGILIIFDSDADGMYDKGEDQKMLVAAESGSLY